MLFTTYTDSEISLLLEVGQIKKFTQYDDDQFVQLSRKIPIFKGLSENDIASLMLNPKFLRFSDKDLIIKEGQIIHEINYILSGSVDIVMHDKVVMSVNQGNLIGLISFVNKTKIPISIISKGNSVIFSFRANMQISSEAKSYTAYLFYKNISKYLGNKITDMSAKMAYV